MTISKMTASSYPTRYEAFQRPGVVFTTDLARERTVGMEHAAVMLKHQAGHDGLYGEVHSYQMSHYVATIQVATGAGKLWHTAWQRSDARLDVLLVQFMEEVERLAKESLLVFEQAEVQANG